MKTTSSKLALIFLATFSSISFAADIVFQRLSAPDKAIVEDAQVGKIAGDNGSACFRNGDLCAITLNSWVSGLPTDSEGKKYLATVMSEPPHIRNPKMVDEFKARYAKWSNSIQQNGVCHLIDYWSFQYVNTGYVLMSNDLSVDAAFKDATRVFTANLKGYIRVANNGKFLNLIPSQFVSQAVYKRLSAYSENRDENTRPLVKICGSFTGTYDENLTWEQNPKKTYAPLPLVYVFEISKPIEFVNPKTLSTLDTVPSEWYGYK
jgi:hypothetical protein